MTDPLMQTLGILAASVILWRAESILNVMSPGCRFIVRLAFWFLFVGAAALTLRIWQGYVPPPAVILSLVGTASLLLSDRRARNLLRAHAHDRKETQ